MSRVILVIKNNLIFCKFEYLIIAHLIESFVHLINQNGVVVIWLNIEWLITNIAILHFLLRAISLSLICLILIIKFCNVKTHILNTYRCFNWSWLLSRIHIDVSGILLLLRHMGIIITPHWWLISTIILLRHKVISLKAQVIWRSSLLLSFSLHCNLLVLSLILE